MSLDQWYHTVEFKHTVFDKQQDYMYVIHHLSGTVSSILSATHVTTFLNSITDAPEHLWDSSIYIPYVDQLMHTYLCQFPRSHNCETQTFFSHNVPKSQSHNRRSSFDRRRKYWLTYQTSVLRPSQLHMTHVTDVYPLTITENKCCHLSAPSKIRIAIISSLSY